MVSTSFYQGLVERGHLGSSDVCCVVGDESVVVVVIGSGGGVRWR